jgi:hypothetical protein
VPGVSSTAIAAETDSVASGAVTAVVRFDVAWLLAGCCTIAGLITLWLTSGVSGSEVVLYLAYVGGFVVLPGIVIAALLDPRPLGLGHVCLGIPLGFLQVMLAFILFAALGVRGLAPWEPLAGMALAGGVLVLRRGTTFAVRLSTRFHWDALLVTAIALVAAGLMVSRDFGTQPLPKQIGNAGATYYNDIPWHIGNTAELKEYWPPRDVRVLGSPFKYYVGDYMQAASTSIATGIQPESLLLRLDPLFQLVVFTFQLYWVGRLIGRRSRTGVVAAFFALLVGDLSSLEPATDSLFVNLFVRDMYLSPTYLLGLVFFVPVLGVLVEWLRRSTGLLARPIFVFSLLALGCGLSKATTLPLLAAGGAGLVAYEAIVWKRLASAGAAVGCLAVAAFFVLSPLVRWHGQESTLSIHPLVTAKGSGAASLLTDSFVGRIPHSDTLIPVLVVLGNAPALLVAAATYVILRGGRLPSAEAAVAALAAAAMAVVLLLTGVGGGELYFWYFGYVAFALIAALGVEALLGRPGSLPRNLTLAAIAVCAVLGVSSMVLQAGPQARRIVARVVPGVPGPFHVVQPTPPALTPPVVRGLFWLREHSDPRSVVAVNNQSNLAASGDGRYFYYSALSQRQIFLEGYQYTVGFQPPYSREAQAEVQGRLRLLDRIYRLGSIAAIQEAHRRFAVSYLLVDKRDDLPRHALPTSATRLVFSDRDLSIYAIAPSA